MGFTVQCGGSSAPAEGTDDNEQQPATQEQLMAESQATLRLVNQFAVSNVLGSLNIGTYNASLNSLNSGLSQFVVETQIKCVEEEEITKFEVDCEGGGQQSVALNYTCLQNDDFCDYSTYLNLSFDSCVVGSKTFNGRIKGYFDFTVSNCGGAGDSDIYVNADLDGIKLEATYDEKSVFELTEIHELTIFGGENCGESDVCVFSDIGTNAFGIVSIDKMVCQFLEEGEQCLPDKDGDGTTDSVDNCPDTYNPAQTEIDGDDFGEICEPYLRDPEEEKLADGIIDLSKVYLLSADRSLCLEFPFDDVVSTNYTYQPISPPISCTIPEDCPESTDACEDGYCRDSTLSPAVCGDCILDTNREECEPGVPKDYFIGIKRITTGLCPLGSYCDSRTCSCFEGDPPGE